MDLITNAVTTQTDTKEIFALSFELLKTAEGVKSLYTSIAQKELAKHLISLYYQNFKTDYEDMIYNFRKRYIENEASIEYNNEDQRLEFKGLGAMYDYIQAYKPSEKSFNLFIETLTLHKLLYKAYDDKYGAEKEKLYNEYKEQLEQAKQDRNMPEYRRIEVLIKKTSEITSSYGGNLRNNEVDLKGVNFHVPTANEAKIFLNSFLSPEKMMEYQNLLASVDIYKYIEYCVKTTTDIIKYQPFENGNKRTARAVLNLMFKNKNIPPVYIIQKERKVYKDALLKAIVDEDYTDIINFYYFKICDSIYELDIVPYMEEKNNASGSRKI